MTHKYNSFCKVIFTSNVYLNNNFGQHFAYLAFSQQTQRMRSRYRPRLTAITVLIDLRLCNFSCEKYCMFIVIFMRVIFVVFLHHRHRITSCYVYNV